MPAAITLSLNWYRRMLVIAIILLVITAGIGYNMFQLYQQELLWAYRPLWLLLAGWFGIVIFRQSRKLKRLGSLNTRPLLLSTLSGLLLGIGFPDILPLPFLLWFAWVPLLLLEQEWRLKGESKKRELLPYLFHTFVLWNIVATYWVMNTSFFAGLFANFANSLLMCIPWVLYLWTRKHLPKMGYASLIAYWLTFEYIHLNWELTWPWLTLGNGWAEYPALIQWYEYTGVFGGSLWIWIVNILLVKVALAAQKNGSIGLVLKAGWLKPTVVMVLPLLVSIFMYTQYEEKGESIDVVVVQPNFEPHYEKFDRVPEQAQLDQFIALSLPMLDTEVDYLLFPETSYGFVQEDNIWASRSSLRLQQAFEAYPQLKLVTGLNAYYDFKASDVRTPATRERIRNGQKIEFEMMNLAAQLPLNPELAPQTYRKSKLVPGPEQFPFRNILFFMEPLVDQLGGTTAGLGTQAERSAFTSETAAIAPVICYESIFGEYYADYVRHGKAQAAFIMTNDGWWDNTAGHRQHLYYASLRAIETRRSIARAANTGISCFINQRGDISQPTAYNEAIAIRGTVTLNNEVTFYVKWRDMIARIALFISILCILNAFVKGRIQSSDSSKANTSSKA